MINIEKIKKAKGYEYTKNSQGILCVLVPVEEDIKNNRKLKALEIIKEFTDFEVFEMEGKCYLTTSHNRHIFIEISKEEYDLLREVLE